MSGSVLLRVGGLGFLLGFASWVAWVVLAVLSFEGLLLYNGDFWWMSGILFQAPASRLIFYGLLSVSSLFSAVGCFALSKGKASQLGFVSGIFFVASFVVQIVYLVPFVGLQAGVYPHPYPVQFFYATMLFPFLFFVGLITWGANTVDYCENDWRFRHDSSDRRHFRSFGRNRNTVLAGNPVLGS